MSKKGLHAFALIMLNPALHGGPAPPANEIPNRPVTADSADFGIPEILSGSQSAIVPSRDISFETDEGTFMNVDVSPDGAALAVDLLGDIYLLPIAGGTPTQLTSGRSWDQAPRFSLHGEQVYFVSDREGFKNLWRLTLSTGLLQQVTHARSDIMGTPNWSHDGIHLLVGVGDAYTRNTEVILNSIDPGTGHRKPIDAPMGHWIDMSTFVSNRRPVKVYSGVESSTGEVFFSQAKYNDELESMAVRLYKFDRKNQVRVAITPPDAPYSDYKPQLSRNGSLLAYFRQYIDRRTELRIRNLETGVDQALIDFPNGNDPSYNASQDSRPNYAFTSDDRSVVFSYGGKIHRVDLSNGSDEIVPFQISVEREVWARAQPRGKLITSTGEAQVVRWPSFSHDGQTMAFSAIGYVWIMDLTTKDVRRLTRSSDFEYMPALSPDGKFVAYTSFSRTERDYWPGRLMVADVNGGTPRQVLAGPNETYLLPKWSQGGQKIAIIREAEKDGGTEAFFGWTPVGSGTFHEVAPAPASDNRLSYRIYARFVGFDETGEKLLFSYRTETGELVLVAANLDGSESNTLAIGAADVGGIVPALDLKKLALIRRDATVWVVPFDAGAESIVVSTSGSKVRRLSNRVGYYVNWRGSGQISCGLGHTVYRNHLDGTIPEIINVDISFEKDHAPYPIVFQGARLLTMSNGKDSQAVIESGTIVVNGQRIAAVGPDSEIVIPLDGVVINGAGTTIMPGLIDTHYHRIGGSSLSALALPNPDFDDRSAIGYGITTAWEPGGAVNDTVPALVDLQVAGRILGPRWSHSAMGAVGYPFDFLTSFAAALDAVRQHEALGVALLKEYNTPTRQQRQWLSVAAHKRGLGIVSHIESFDGMMTRIVDGYTGGEHSYFPVPFHKDVRELLRQTGYIWTPNTVISLGSTGDLADAKTYYWRHVSEVRAHELEELKSLTSVAHQFAKKRAKVPYEIHRISRVAAQAASAAAHGIHIGVSGHNMPGSNLHREMWYLWKGGMPIEDVLRAATIGNARKLGLHGEVGSLEVGKIADFLVLEENPLDDILNTLSLKYTVQGGVVYDSTSAEKVNMSRAISPNTTAAAREGKALVLN